MLFFLLVIKAACPSVSDGRIAHLASSLGLSSSPVVCIPPRLVYSCVTLAVVVELVLVPTGYV